MFGSVDTLGITRTILARHFLFVPELADVVRLIGAITQNIGFYSWSREREISFLISTGIFLFVQLKLITLVMRYVLDKQKPFVILL